MNPHYRMRQLRALFRWIVGSWCRPTETDVRTWEQ